MEHLTVTLIPENQSFTGKRVVIVNQPISFGRLLDNQEQQTVNFLRFNSKVVSRQHAKLTYQDGKFFIQDTKSSSGTYVNGERLSAQGVESKLQELHDGDIVKFGEDYNAQGSYHQAIVMKVKLPGGKPEEEMLASPPEEEAGYVDVTMDPEVKQSVDDEFNSIWNSLVADINSPLKKLKNGALLNALQQPLTANSQNSTTATQNRSDTTVTLIKTNSLVVNQTSGDSVSPTATATADKINNELNTSNSSNSNINSNANNKQQLDAATALECVALIESLEWESSELKENLIELAKKQDQQLFAFYKSLKGFPSSFVNVASKYAKSPPVKTENTDDEEDEYIQRIRKTGCYELHEQLQECYWKTKDWRQCQHLVQQFKECFSKQQLIKQDVQ